MQRRLQITQKFIYILRGSDRMVSEKKKNESETVMLNFEFHLYSCDPSKISKKEFGMIRFVKCQPYPSIFAMI